MSKRAEEAALKAYPDKEVNSVSLVFSEQRRLFKEGYEQAEKDTISIIESRIGEILGDAQPNPILRAELRELIEKIKEDEE